MEETLNTTEGNLHQLVALLHCRGLHKVTPVPLPKFLSPGNLCLTFSSDRQSFHLPLRNLSLYRPCIIQHLFAT